MESRDVVWSRSRPFVWCQEEEDYMALLQWILKLPTTRPCFLQEITSSERPHLAIMIRKEGMKIEFRRIDLDEDLSWGHVEGSAEESERCNYSAWSC